RHPYDTLDTTFCFHEFLGRDKVFSMSHESRCLNTAACHGSQLWEGHSKRSHSGILTVCDDNTIGEWLDTADTFKASAGSHWFLHNRVQRYILKSPLRQFLNCFIYIFIFTDSLIDWSFFCDHLTWSIWIQL